MRNGTGNKNDCLGQFCFQGPAPSVFVAINQIGYLAQN
jgi:hypothetical protein